MEVVALLAQFSFVHETERIVKYTTVSQELKPVAGTLQAEPSGG